MLKRTEFMQFEYLDHTADLKIKAHGNTIEEAFESAALAATNFLTDVSKVGKVEVKKINIKAPMLDTLLYEFLEAMLALIDTDGFLFSGAKKIQITKAKAEDSHAFEYELHCIALGDHYKNYDMKGDLKAITYSEMNIDEKEGRFEITVVYDI